MEASGRGSKLKQFYYEKFALPGWRPSFDMFMLYIRTLLPVIPELHRTFFTGIRFGMINYSAAILIKCVAAKKSIVRILIGFLLWIET